MTAECSAYCLPLGFNAVERGSPSIRTRSLSLHGTGEPPRLLRQDGGRGKSLHDPLSEKRTGFASRSRPPKTPTIYSHFLDWAGWPLQMSSVLRLLHRLLRIPYSVLCTYQTRSRPMVLCPPVQHFKVRSTQCSGLLSFSPWWTEYRLARENSTIALVFLIDKKTYGIIQVAVELFL